MILSVENGSFGYKSGKNIFNDINFSVTGGDLLAILGPNGAGKTTLLRCIMGFLNWINGKSTLDGTDLRRIPPRELWSRISYVPQSKSAACSYSVEDMIMLGRGSSIGFFRQPTKDDELAVAEIMNKLNIDFLRGKACNQISGGELQMVLIAKALATKPEILILDEPESNLDFRNQLLVLDTISRLVSEGMTCIFNTHYPAHALQRANKALLLDKSGNSLFGDTETVVTEENIENAFGVKAVIGEVETRQSIMKDVIPLTVTDKPKKPLKLEYIDKEQLAVISIAATRESADSINALLHEYHSLIVGRMGMPYKKYNVNVINLTLDGPISELEILSSRLGALPGVSVKTIYTGNDD